MGEVDEVQEQIKANIEALKEQMATMMEAMMSMKKIMEVNAAVVAATSTVAKVDPTPSFGLNQINHPTSDMIGREAKNWEVRAAPILCKFKIGMPSCHMV